VDNDRRIISVGFNGPPRGTNDERAYADRETKLRRVLHAEENAILFAGHIPRGCTMYSTHHPCAHCAALICQVNIMAVYYPAPDENFLGRWADEIKHAQAMFSEAGVLALVPVTV
jgi:dCMP deaminase